MNSRIVSFFKLILTSVVYWIFAFILFIALRYNGLEQELAIFTDEELFLPIRTYFEVAILLGAILGFIYAVVEFLFDVFIVKRLVLGFSLVVKSIIYFIIIIVLLSSFSIFIENSIDIDLPNDRGWWYKDPFFWTTFIFFVISSIVFSLVRIANDKFGRGNFIQILLGKYKRPKEEERILMFLDLKDSTKIAEHLGHQKYSRFIQACFIDLNSVLRKYEAEIYQYVGDEAVIYWSTKRGFLNNNCINLLFAFQKRLIKRDTYYNKEFAFSPKFKAGLHFGKLMVAEIGTIKKDLAFHGDVINTASRIQSLCNGYKQSLIVSEPVLKQLNISTTHYKLLSDDIELRGKQERLKIYAILNNNSI